MESGAVEIHVRIEKAVESVLCLFFFFFNSSIKKKKSESYHHVFPKNQVRVII